MKNYAILLLIMHTAICMFSNANAADQTGYLSVTGPCNLEFPRDHGPHSGYRTEWWYYTGNLQAASGEKYGFQLTFFRSQIRPPADLRRRAQPASAWRTQQIYMAHSAISNLADKQHLQAELVARGALGMAGADRVGDTTTIFLKDWSARIGPDRHLLKVQTDEFTFEMVLTPEKPPVMHGTAGYSRKGQTADKATCYYSFSRFSTRGKLSIDENVVQVTGSAWMDHEYGTDILGSGIKGWDWFSLQLSDNTEVMVFLVKSKKGEIEPTSSATVIGQKDLKRHLHSDDFKVTVLETWKSPNSKAVYPAAWRLQIFPESLELMIKPNLADQEMLTIGSTGTIYWEGSVSAAGTKGGKPLTGVGYIELTGYAEPFNAPM
jgi:predicted secreted hydrolase